MGMRKYLRNIAKDRMADMHIGEVNKKMGVSDKVMTRRQMMRMERTYNGRRKVRLILRKMYNWPMWRRVLFGNMAKAGYQAQMMHGMRIVQAKEEG